MVSGQVNETETNETTASPHPPVCVCVCVCVFTGVQALREEVLLFFYTRHREAEDPCRPPPGVLRHPPTRAH